LPELFLEKLWPGLVVWTVLYISDYSLTIACARLYQAGARDKIAFEGSYEITPYYQQDINALRLVSPRFLAALLLMLVLLSLVWWLGTESLGSPMYSFALGALVLVELAVHVRHFRNLVLFRMLVGSDAIRGGIQYPRPLMLRMSSIEFFAFSGLFSVVFLFTGSWFVLGGAMACLSVAVKHWRLAGPGSLAPANKFD
jgi:hypothetical protein